MDFKEYYSAREQLVKILKDDFLGPVSEDEVLTEPPVVYYISGKLYPKNILKIDDNGDVITEEDIFDDETELLSNQMYQSAMGITFSISAETKSFDIVCNVAYYDYSEEVNDEKKSIHKWTRRTLYKSISINTSDVLNKAYTKHEVFNQLYVHIRAHLSKDSKSINCIVSLVNNGVAVNSKYEELSRNTFFQPEIMITNLNSGAFCDIRKNDISVVDEETASLELIYKNYKSYAGGHGCSATWTVEDGVVKKVFTDFLPEYEVKQMMPSNCFDKKILSMAYLATAPYSEVSVGLEKAINGYNLWITDQYLASNGNDVAKANLSKCENVLNRLTESISLLSDNKVYQAFQLANETMYYQRTKKDDLSDNSITWYPFQLAFLLLEIKSIIDPNCTDRSVVDLLWFPTGGGKTEAYLGISAFILFYERVSDLGKYNTEHVSIVMRYTLRLLSLQQFERASAMICAADLLRAKNKLGSTPFSIGLWVGDSLTPNRLDEADLYLRKGESSSYSNPVQFKKCPWCGTKLGAADYFVDKQNKRMHITCNNSKCDFSSGLPIHLIDDDIYAHKPSFIISTIDKFVQIAYKDEAGSLFGAGNKNLSPSLIIQDELHLISGPLGTMSGIFEAAIQKLFENSGVTPKVIASTATIRNADNQVKALYGKACMQFPPQGIDTDDSFFAKKSTRDEKPARNYLGIMPSGISKSTAFVRIMGALLFASRYLVECGYSDEVIDSFWTHTGYFNNLRDLGSALIRVIDSVQDRFNYLRKTKFLTSYPISNEKSRYAKLYELTSRNSSSDLGEFIQNELMIPYKRKSDVEPYDFLLASNMISVGVDVSRLGSMLVIGQPIKTAEYIQATSRVGRTTPGLVVTMFNGAKTRDRSHYEQFIPYHSSFYKYVEPTGLTPFSDRARDRGLQALYVLLVRYSIPKMKDNKDAVNYSLDLPGLQEIREYILNYVRNVDPYEVTNVEKELDSIETFWNDRAEKASSLSYYNYNRDDDSLYKEDYKENSRFRMMNSMRSVESSVEVDVEE